MSSTKVLFECIHVFYAFKYETKHKLVFDLYSDKHIPASSFSFFQLRALSRQISQAYIFHL